MRRVLLISSFIFIICQSLFGQIHSSWTEKDFKLIDSVIKLDKNNPTEIEEFFSKHKDFRKKKQLGFGWTSLERGIGAGYISIYATFFYFKDTIKTYILEAWLPHEEVLVNEYKSYYSKLFPVNLGNKYQYLFGSENIMHPIVEFDSAKLPLNVSHDILKYMSPTSGITYGYRGGLGSTVLQNRQMFNKIKDKLTQDQLLVIMYSINPASRLTAIEYYQKNRKRYKLTEKINQWIEKVYNELPRIETMRGCIGLSEDSRALVKEFSESKAPD